MTDALKQQLLGFLRHALTLGAGWLVGKGWLPADLSGELVGLGMVLGPFIWSAFDKYWSERRMQVRETAAVQAGVIAARTDGAIAHLAATSILPDHAQEIIETAKEAA